MWDSSCPSTICADSARLGTCSATWRASRPMGTMCPKPSMGTDRVDDVNLVSLLPHQPPMRLLDSACMADDERLLARQHVPLTDAVLRGHFPGLPIWPGALL